MDQNKKKSQQQTTQTPFEGPYKTKPSAIAGKKGIGYSTVRHLARMGMKKVMAKEEHVQEGNYVPSDVHINPNEKFAKEKEKAHNAAVQKAKQMVAARPKPMKTESFKSFRAALQEKTLTKAEMKKREEVAQAIERENPNMPMGMKMAIATKTAKRVAEENLEELDRSTLSSYVSKASDATKHRGMPTKKVDNRYSGVAKATKRLDKLVKEEVEEDQHLCAKHVRSGLLGDGVVLEAQHADPDENGQIEWYMVEFKDGIHKVYTEDLEIMLAEYHGNHKKKKR